MKKANLKFQINKKTPKPTEAILIPTSYDIQANAVCEYNKQKWLIKNALVGEKVLAQSFAQKQHLVFAKAVKIIEANAEREKPFCQYFNLCGACDLQHFNAKTQLKIKENALLEKLKILNFNIKLDDALPTNRNYRRKVHFAARFENKDLKIGFRKNSSNTIVDIENCLILTENLQIIFPKFKSLINKISNKKAIGHIEFLEANKISLLINLITNLDEKDKQIFIDFAKREDLQVIFQKENEQEIFNKQDIFYYLDELQIFCDIHNFVQANESVNNQLLQRAKQYLKLTKEDILFDFFTGIGNFSLAFAKICKEVVAFEVDKKNLQSLQENAKINNIHNIKNFEIDLFTKTQIDFVGVKAILLDPPRDGAFELCSNIINNKIKPEKILYISCNYQTFLRDLKILSTVYQLKNIALADMFSYTSHIELIAYLELK